MTKEERDELKLKEIAVASYIESKITGRLPSETEIETLMKSYCSLLYPELNSEGLEEMKKMLNERFQFKLDIGTLIYDQECEPWFKEFKANNKCNYFDRYKEYLLKEKGFNRQALEVLDNEVLDDIMDYLGNPETNFNPRRGLVMGDVQSGKTATYTGLICKAADAGYKAIIVLTGTVECLRQQTQKRLDEGFVGFDSDHMSKVDDEDFWIGVGKYSKKRGIVLTSKNTDFVASTAKNLGFSLDNFNDTVLFVVKKNVPVLNRLLKWLSDLNGKSGKIDYPLLVIDDEADNASINTNATDEDLDPTKINNCIRKLLKMFTKNNYVGFTATPFANVFINPYISDDLFPKDFIYGLKAPSGYIGAADIFLDDSKYRNSVISNNDCEEILPLKHKKHVDFTEIPSTLEDAIFSYFITNVIRDMRGDNFQHRGMLINISRFTSPQEQIKETVENFVMSCLSKFKLYCNFEGESSGNIKSKIEQVYKSYYGNLEISFDKIWKELYNSNSRIEIINVNSNSKMINYDDYKDVGARLIVIGGLSLSRGLTIEGLCISYLYRTSQVYDVLLQMGRWFGYRKNYDDLFRIWMPLHMVEWYKEITLAVEELKLDLEKMKNLKQRPSEFGIRIRSDKTGLKITARNKMLASADYEVVKSMFGDWDNTGIISADLDINRKNYKLINDVLTEITDKGYKWERTYGDRFVWKDVPKEYVLKVLNGFIMDKGNFDFNAESYSTFINTYIGDELDLFDIAIIEGDRSNGKKIPFFGDYIVKPEKNFSRTKTGISMNKARSLLVNPIDTSYGLDEATKKDAEKKHKELVLKQNPNKDPKTIHVSAKSYLRVTNRRPLLMIYLIDLKVNEQRDDETNDEYNSWIETKELFDSNNVTPVGIALAIPEYSKVGSKCVTYKVNMVEQHNLLIDNEEDYDD